MANQHVAVLTAKSDRGWRTFKRPAEQFAVETPRLRGRVGQQIVPDDPAADTIGHRRFGYRRQVRRNRRASPQKQRNGRHNEPGHIQEMSPARANSWSAMLPHYKHK